MALPTLVGQSHFLFSSIIAKGEATMKQYSNNQATEYVYGALFGFNFEEEGLPGKEDIEKLNAVSNFTEYVYEYAKRCGFLGDTSDTKKLTAFLYGKCKEANVKISRQTLGNWLTRAMPAGTVNGRENVYQLCFALQMNGRQAAEFFLKAYLERPFNYKDIREAVYFFCMNNGLTYSDALRIIAEVEKSAINPNPYADDVTEQIGVNLAKIKSEEGVIQYLVENRSGFLIQNQTATERINALVKSCCQIASREYAIYSPYDKEITVNNVDELLSVIYGYAARATENAKSVYKKSISKSNFPELIRRNWPQREQFQQILDKKNASFDVIRRALIMLVFYDFYANAVVAEKEAEKRRRKTGKAEAVESVAEGLFDEFGMEANTILSECGYVQLYWRNPFDWMIGYCAMSPEPLRTLRDLIIEYYLSDPTVNSR
jgi:hypothetical protein